MTGEIDRVPEWLGWTGSIAGIFAVIIQIIFFIFNFFRRGKLEAKLTKEIFFRISDLGECLFPNVVLFARDGGVEIKDINFELKRIGPSQKKYTLSVLFMGDKKNGIGPFAENNFFSKSPVAFVPKDKPLHTVYLTSLEEYNSKMVEEFNNFTIKLSKLKEEKDELTKNQPISDEVVKSFFQRLEYLIKETRDKIFDLIQIEYGEYELSVSVNYISNGIFGKKVQHTIPSSVKFQIENSARDLIKIGLEKTLELMAESQLKDPSIIAIYPEYSPSNVKEV